MPPKTAGKISGIWMYFPEKRQDILPVRCAAPMHATRAGWRVLAGGGVAIRLPPRRQMPQEAFDHHGR